MIGDGSVPVSGRAERSFLVDVNVGRLARWLRIMGHDALYLPDANDDDLVRVAMRDSRTLLTRDGQLCHRRLVTSGVLPVVLLTSGDLWEQIRHVAETLDLPCRPALTRCVECNTRLEPVEKAAVRDRVPPYVFRTQQEFVTCPACERVYWKGTHWLNMGRELRRVREGVG